MERNKKKMIKLKRIINNFNKNSGPNNRTVCNTLILKRMANNKLTKYKMREESGHVLYKHVHY